MADLRSVQLDGFRSFRNPISFNLNPRITALLGPDMCGKTSILDSIEWCLHGCEDPESVLFRGTPKREPALHATVSLELESPSGNVSLSRTLTRSGTATLQFNSPETAAIGSEEGVATIADDFARPTSIEELDAIASTAHRQVILLDEPESWDPDGDLSRLEASLRSAGDRHQIILATHSKTLLASAETFVGITMVEFGVSTLLSETAQF